MWSGETVGLALAVSSSLFIGSSFIIKKRGLRVAGATGVRAGAGGFGYLKEPVCAVLAHIFLKEYLNVFGILGCILCITGSLTIVLHAPAEAPIESVAQVWYLAMQPGFLLYSLAAVAAILYLIFWVSPTHGTENVLVYLGICSLAGSFTVTSCKALGVALKLTFQGDNQLGYIHFYLFLGIVVTCLLTQMNYLNKALDLFNTAIVSPIYYVMFTLLTIIASVIMFQDEQSNVQMATQGCGFVTIVGGTFLLHTTKDLDLTGLHMEEMVRQPSIAASSSTAVGSSSVRERRGREGSSIELGKAGTAGMESIKVTIDGGDKGGGANNDDEQHPLLITGANGNSNSSSALGSRKGRASGLFGF